MPANSQDPPHDSVATAWAAVTERLRAEVSEVTYHVWLARLEPAAVAGGTLYVRAPEQVRSWVTERYGWLLRDSVRATGVARRIELVDHSWRGAEETVEDAPPTGLNPRYSFDQFVISDGNRLAHAAALSVAEQPAHAYNPLFIHGRPGLGKTHLLHAIGNFVRSYGDGLSVRYATVEDFTSGFVRSVRSEQTGRFRDGYRRVDVLLIDDIQFLAEKLRTEEEFFHTFNALYEAGSQVVLTSDRKPRDIAALEARLRERFEHGLVAELEPPSFEARMAILAKRARLDDADVDEATIATIARHVSASVRSLEGALVRVVAYASLRGEPATPGLAADVLERLYPRLEPQSLTLADVQAAAAELFEVSRRDLLAHDRRPRLAFARQVAMFVARELTGESLPAIGEGFGGRKHSTVLHAVHRVSDQLANDADTASAVDALRARLRASGDRSG